MKPVRRLSDCPVFITNMEGLLTTALDIMHELDRSALTDGDREAFDRAISVLTIGQDACGSFVADVESGPDYRLDGKGGAQ